LSEIPRSPRAARLATPSWLDGRLVLGVLLVLVSVVVGARLLSAADRSTLVYAVTKDLAAGSVLQTEDLVPVRVRLYDRADRYIAASSAVPSGYVVRRAIDSGELLPLAALSLPEEDVDFRLVTVPVDQGHFPPSLTDDQQVDVWVTPEAAADGGAEPGPGAPSTDEPEPRGARLVLQGVSVHQVARDGAGFGGATSVPVVLQVRPREVAALVTAMSTGRIDLVRVPRKVESSGRLEPARAG
jgi:hypothetical protein